MNEQVPRRARGPGPAEGADDAVVSQGRPQALVGHVLAYPVRRAHGGHAKQLHHEVPAQAAQGQAGFEKRHPVAPGGLNQIDGRRV